MPKITAVQPDEMTTTPATKTAAELRAELLYSRFLLEFGHALYLAWRETQLAVLRLDWDNCLQLRSLKGGKE